MNNKGSNKVPPDGGWGWIIVVASALNGIATIPIMQGFGLIFKDTFPLFGFSATDGTVIINTNLAFGMLLGLVNGPLLRNFGYRKVAVAGTFVYTIGVTLTAFARSFGLIMISYGVLASLGMGVTMSAFSYALNSYFTTKRGRATGLALTITGLGPILMPQLTSFLMSFYGVQGTMLLYGSFTLHSLIGAVLLQPLKWHTRSAPPPYSKGENHLAEELGKETSIGERRSNVEDGSNRKENSTVELNRFERKRKTTISSIDHDAEVGRIYGFETPLPRQLSETLKTPSWERNIDVYKVADSLASSGTNLQNRKQSNCTWWSSARSIDTVNLGSSMKIFEEYQPDTLSRYYSFDDLEKRDDDRREVAQPEALLEKAPTEVKATPADATRMPEAKPAVAKILQRIVDFYDLGLLRDPIYVNIMIGMSIAIFAEINFSLLTPFILSDMGLSTRKIATVMSLIASVDLLSRSVAPFLGEWLRQPPRTMYLLSLILLIISRTTLTFTNGFTSVLFVAIGLGAAKGIRSVYMSLVVPSYVPIHRLPYASGIQMIINGIVLMSAGPILGLIRDNTGSYIPCIFMMNCVTALTVIMWLSEMYIVHRKNLGKKAQRQEDDYLLQK